MHCDWRVAGTESWHAVELGAVGGGVHAARVSLGPIPDGAEVEYTITAWDRAGQPNRRVLPETGVYRTRLRPGRLSSTRSHPSNGWVSW